MIDAAGDDRVVGGRGPDTVTGGDGLDRIWGGRGADRLFGGVGNDRIWGGVGNDQSWGDDGDDTFKTRDGEADTIDCGVGTDTALLDFKDVIADATAQNPNGSCEVVNRERRLKKGQDSPENAEPRENVSGA